MLRCDSERRNYLMDCVRVAQTLKIKTRVTRDYVTLNPGPFREVPELSKLVLPYFGTPAVDKKDLDALIDAEKARLKAQKEV